MKIVAEDIWWELMTSTYYAVATSLAGVSQSHHQLSPALSAFNTECIAITIIAVERTERQAYSEIC